MTADAPLLVLLHAIDEHTAVTRATASAREEYDTVEVIDCRQGSGEVWTVRLAVSDRKAAADCTSTSPDLSDDGVLT